MAKKRRACERLIVLALLPFAGLVQLNSPRPYSHKGADGGCFYINLGISLRS